MIKLLKPLDPYLSALIRKIHLSGFILIITLLGCSKGPEETVSKYLDHTFVNSNGKKAYKLLSSGDKMVKSEDEFIYEIKRNNILHEKLQRKHKERYTYKILNIKHLNKDTLLIKVGLTKPNAHKILHEMIPFSKASSIYQLSEESETKEAIQKQYKNILEGEQMEVEQEEKEYVLIKEKNGYKVLLNFREDSLQPLDNKRMISRKSFSNYDL